MTDAQKKQIHDLLYNGTKEFIPVQEITKCAAEICETPTEDTLQSVATYLAKFPYYRLEQPTMVTTGTQKSMAGNDVRFAISDIRKYLASIVDEDEDNEDDDLVVDNPTKD